MRLFHLVQFVKCWQIVQKLKSKDFFFFILFYFILFYNHNCYSFTIQLHGTYLQQDYKIYLRYSFTTYLFATYLH